MKTFDQYLHESITADGMMDQVSKVMDIIRVGSKIRKSLDGFEKNSDAKPEIKKVREQLDALSAALVKLADKL